MADIKYYDSEREINYKKEILKGFGKSKTCKTMRKG